MSAANHFFDKNASVQQTLISQLKKNAAGVALAVAIAPSESTVTVDALNLTIELIHRAARKILAHPFEVLNPKFALADFSTLQTISPNRASRCIHDLSACPPAFHRRPRYPGPRPRLREGNRPLAH